MARLRRADCSTPGISRRRSGRGFVYLDEAGDRIEDEETLERIRGLAVPPAWTDVWICPFPNGHIQAVGTDARGRRQYRYHDDWRIRRDAEKFERMLEFARALPSVRKSAVEVLGDGSGALTRERVLACAVRLLDLGFFRIGTESYAEVNESFGLATMRRRHVTVEDGMVTFDYPAKGRARRLQRVADPAVVRVVKRLKRRRGRPAELLAYRAGGRWVDVRSEDVNDHIRMLSGADFTAKDFRTWNATVLAAVALAVSTRAATSPTATRSAVVRAVKEVAEYLGNTPAVARSSYIDPRVVDAYRAGVTIERTLARLGEEAEDGGLSTQGPVERAVLRMLEGKARAAPARESRAA